MGDPDESILKVRRSIHIAAAPGRVWREFETIERMRKWWGAMVGSPEAGTAQGQWVTAYEPRVGGHIEMAVDLDGARVAYGGPITVFAPDQELTFQNDWIPNRGWIAPTFMTLRLRPALAGALVELLHHGFEHTGGDVAAAHAGYEAGWGVTQLAALKRVVEASRGSEQ